MVLVKEPDASDAHVLPLMKCAYILRIKSLSDVAAHSSYLPCPTAFRVNILRIGATGPHRLARGASNIKAVVAVDQSAGEQFCVHFKDRPLDGIAAPVFAGLGA